jgi:hypothetical protein
MKLGAEPKKVVILGVLTVVGGYLAVSNFWSSDGPPRSTPVAAPKPAATAQPQRGVTAQPPPPNIRRDRRQIGGSVRSSQEFRPTLKRRPEDYVDPVTVDPTLRTDLLAKLDAIRVEGGSRSLFDFSQPPAPPKPKGPPEPKIIPKPFGPQPPPVEAAKVEPPKPPPTPIPLKFYGFISPQGSTTKRAFFLDAEDIIVASEGELIKRRYKVVRIGVNSVVMEDVEQKHQQTIPLTEEQQQSG